MSRTGIPSSIGGMLGKRRKQGVRDGTGEQGASDGWCVPKYQWFGDQRGQLVLSVCHMPGDDRIDSGSF